MGLYDSDSSKCRRHPNEKQHPGVCSSCLREKLSKINATPSSFTSSRYRTSVVSHSSSVSATPPAGNRHRRNGSDVLIAAVSGSGLLGLNLKKSKSVSCAPLSRSRGGSHRGESNNKLGKMFGEDSNSGSSSKKFEMGGIEETGEIRRKKGGFFKRFIIHSTGKKV